MKRCFNDVFFICKNVSFSSCKNNTYSERPQKPSISALWGRFCSRNSDKESSHLVAILTNGSEMR